LGTATRHRVTVAANWDAEPSLSRAGGRLMLAWTRSASATSAAGPSHIYLATSTGGPWAGRRYTGLGITNAHPSLATGHQDKVVWNRDGRALIGRVSGGVEHDFGSSTRAELAVSGTTVMVAWEVVRPGIVPGTIDATVDFATSSTGSWADPDQLSPRPRTARSRTLAAGTESACGRAESTGATWSRRPCAMTMGTSTDE
jgi:hypothetical protein